MPDDTRTGDTLAVAATTTEPPPDVNMSIGDVVSFGPHPTVPGELVDKYFRVEAMIGEAGEVRGWKLSRPYVDAECTVPYHAKPPTRHRGKWPNA